MIVFPPFEWHPKYDLFLIDEVKTNKTSHAEQRKHIQTYQ